MDYDITPAMIARIAEQCPGFRYVDEAWFSKPVDDYDQDTPAALVYIGDDAGGTPSEQGSRQPVSARYGVFIVCERGDTFRAQRHEVRQALFGWQPPGSKDVMAYHAGEMVEIRGRYVWWREFWQLVDPLALQATRGGTTRPRTMTV